MRYSDNFAENERQATADGMRERVTADELIGFIGTEENNYIECLLDVINGIYAVEDLINDIKTFGKE